MSKLIERTELLIELFNKEKEIMDQLIDDYDNFFKEGEFKTIKVHYQKIMIGKVCNLLVKMKKNGATAEDINLMERLLFAVINAKKYSLDIRKAKKELHFSELKRKYDDDHNYI